MKDKLVKTKHKAGHYYFKKIGFCFSLFVGAAIVVAIPLSIATIVKNNEKEEAKENENKTKVTSEAIKQELLVF